jgi:hypothetical protein
MSKFYFTFIFIFCVLINIKTVAQDTSKTKYIADTRKMFLEMARVQLALDLKKVSAVQETETQKISQLIALKDSLKIKREINDSLASDIGNRLINKQMRIDSINNVIRLLSQRINSLSALKGKFVKITEEVKKLNGDVNENLVARKKALLEIEKEMDIPDFAGERGALKVVLKTADAQLKKEEATATAIDGKKDSLLSDGKIDETISGGLTARLKAYKQRMDSISNEIGVLSKKLESPEDFRKDRPVIKAKIAVIDSVVNQNAHLREYSFSMIEEGLLKSKKVQYSLAAFFGPGGYKIPQDKYKLARKYFSPIIDSLIEFSNKYSSVERLSSIIVHGYADATSIPPGSGLHKQITTYLEKPDATKEDLNKGLSALRAEEISKFLTAVVKDRATEFRSIKSIIFEFIEFGQGEKLPDPEITDYKVNDERRRIVMLFWSVLPNL